MIRYCAAGAVSTLLLVGLRTAWAVPAEEATSARAAAVMSPEQAAAGFAMPADFRVELFAAGADVANPVAFTIDELGRVFVCETFRQNHGVSDNRGQNREWVDADLASQSVADREAYHRRLLGPEVADWESHDDRVRLLVDTDGDGRADEVSAYAEGFHRLIDGTAAGLLARRGDLYMTCIPALYRLRDLDGDGRIAQAPPEREILSEGYGCRVAYRGHDLHGLTLGPDGRLYFSIGDRGYRVEHEGGMVAEPGRGAVFRCRPDGSEFEVFATGLRNPQELAFDDLGNLFTVDNNCDGGDKARLVHVVPGGDSGWTMEYQYLADRGPWNREGMWELPHEGQPAWIVPPLAHIGAGPAGLAAYPGTGLPERFAGRFLLCDFRGGAAQSSVRSFKLEPAGGSFRLVLDEETFQNVLATDVEFGPDGAVWVSDWVHGWNGEGTGRIWRFVPQERDERLVAEVRSLLAGDWAALEQPRLVQLLGHADRRLRLEAQWELVRRGARNPLLSVLTGSGPLLGRFHAIQGLAALSDGGGESDLTAALVACLADPVGEIRSVICRTLGDLPQAGSREVLVLLAERLNDPDPQVRLAAGITLGRLGRRRLEPAVIEQILAAAARDLESDGYLRHAIVSAVAGGLDDAALSTAAADSSAAVRLAVCLAMRRRHDARIVDFLTDQPRIAAEAVRAIHDLPFPDLFEPLAGLLSRPATLGGGQSQSTLQDTIEADPELTCRMVSAAERVGTPAAATLLAGAAANERLPRAARVMALEALGDWASPPDRDRINGRWQPHAAGRDSALAWAALAPVLPPVLATRDGPVRRAALDAAARLSGSTELVPLLVEICVDRDWEESSRAAALVALGDRDRTAAVGLAERLLQDSSPSVRTAARGVLAVADPARMVVELERVVIDPAADLGERQAGIDLLATIDHPGVAEQVGRLADRLTAGGLDPVVALEVREAAINRLGRSVMLPGHDDDPLADWAETMAGGDAARGREIFFGKIEVSCVRCHQAEGSGGEVGPRLDGIGGRKDARYLLESIVSPNAQVAEDFKTTIVVTDEGLPISWIVVSEDSERLTLRTAEGELVVVPLAEIDERATGPSAMPADLAGKLSRRELRDLVAWLVSLHSDRATDAAAVLP